MDAVDARPKVGWIGTGRMGFPLVCRLLNAGYDIAVYNRTRARAEPLQEYGAVIVDSPAQLAQRDIVFSMVTASQDLLDVMLGDGGLLTGEASPRIVSDSSTVSVEAGRELRMRAARRGVAVLASPVSGNPRMIPTGQLAVAVSGPHDAFLVAEPVLRSFGRSVTYVGDDECARLVKIAHNILLGVTTQVLAEVTVLMESGGVARGALLDFLNASELGSIFLEQKTPALVGLDFSPTFTMPLLLKDFDLAMAAGNDLGVPMPIASATRQIVAQEVGEGNIDQDFATLLLRVARGAGLKLHNPAHRDPEMG